MTKKPTIDTPSLAYLDMICDLELVTALMGGTEAMREAGQKYLPREPKESVAAYRNRLSRSVLYNAFADTVQKLVGKPFSKPVNILQDTPEQIKEWCNDIDLTGGNITTFCREIFEYGLTDGLVHLLVDYPRNDGEKTLADEQILKTRPYIVPVRAADLIGWRSELINGIRTLTQVRIRENATEADGDWGEKLVQRIRVLYPDRFELYELQKKAWVIVDQGVTSIGRIPLVTYYTGKTCYMAAKPPLLDLAHLNVLHWQSSSDQEHILHFIRFPLLHGAGFAQDQKDIEIGPNRMIISEDAQAKLTFVEHTGAAVDSGRKAILDIEQKMETMGGQLLTQRSGDSTATAAALDTAKINSALHDMVRRLENAMQQAFGLMMLWAKMPADTVGGVNINEDFGLSLISGKDEDTLLKSRLSGELSRESYLTELKRRNVLRNELDVEEEMTRIETEGHTNTNNPNGNMA
jgi:hypothetical protein